MTIWRWADRLINTPEPARITLGEGNTPLVRSRQIGPAAGIDRLYFKLEISNPTGSYKDRFAAAAISDMIANGRHRCIATSSGNTGSALAAYCAAAGLACHIATVETAPDGKLKQMLAYGADVFRVNGFGLDAQITEQTFNALAEIGSREGNSLQISAFRYSPIGMTGVQTISYELDEQSDGPINHVFCPAGGGGLTLATARGFRWLADHGRCENPPAIQCVQPEGNDTIAGPLRDGAIHGHAVSCTSRISGLQVPSLIDGDEVITACRASGGTGHLVTDESVWDVQRRLAREEGILCEPAGAVALAGALKAVESGLIDKNTAIVCLITGSGFKDEKSLDRMIEACDATCVSMDQIEQHLSERHESLNLRTGTNRS